MSDVYWFCEECHTSTMIPPERHRCDPLPAVAPFLSGQGPTSNAPTAKKTKRPSEKKAPKEKAKKAAPPPKPKRVEYPPPRREAVGRAPRQLTPEQEEAFEFIKDVAFEHARQMGRTLLGKLVGALAAARVDPNDDDDYDFAFEVAYDDPEDFFEDEEELFWQEVEEEEFRRNDALEEWYEDEEEDDFDDESPPLTFAERLRAALYS